MRLRVLPATRDALTARRLFAVASILMPPLPISRAELPSETVAQARWLLGRLVVRHWPEGVAAGRIVETEAYPPGDAAMHAYRGLTQRNRSLFLAHGHAYVYLCYGVSMMLNVSSEAAGVGAGVLLRAIEPVDGIALMTLRRAGVRTIDIARGPGRLAAALEIDRRLDGVDLCAPGALYLAHDPAPPDGRPATIGESTRIGITKDAHRVLRFFVRGSRFVSGPGSLNGRGPAAERTG